MLELHILHNSPFNAKIVGQLNYKGIEYETITWTASKLSKVKKFNSTGKLPALKHNDQWIGDSTDIAYHLEHCFPEQSLLPTSEQSQALMHIVEDWSDESLYFYEMMLRFGTDDKNQSTSISHFLKLESGFSRWLLSKLVPGSIKKIARTQGLGRKNKAQILNDVERHLHSIAALLDGNDWLLDNKPTLADFSVFGMLNAFYDAKEGERLILKQPQIVTWMSRVNEIVLKGSDISEQNRYTLTS